jgi:hypothetical protein
MKEAPDFFKDLEEKFINELTEMGFDYTDIKDFIEDKGLPELNLDYAIDSMSKKESYKNPLYNKQEGPGHQGHHSMSYDYHDPMSKPPMTNPINRVGQIPQGQNMLRNYDTNASLMQPSEYDQERETCKVCMNTQIDTVFIPCGHRAVCNDCGKGLKEKICPICRKPIQQIVKTFDT